MSEASIYFIFIRAGGAPSRHHPTRVRRPYHEVPGSSTCAACPAGKLSESLNSTVCSNCPSGGYCSAAGAASLRLTFEPCPAGSYNPSVGANGTSSCVACVAGKANPIPGSTDASVCMPCGVGTAANHSGAATCTACPDGSFANETGTVTCQPCVVCGEDTWLAVQCNPFLGAVCQPCGNVETRLGVVSRVSKIDFEWTGSKTAGSTKGDLRRTGEVRVVCGKGCKAGGSALRHQQHCESSLLVWVNNV